MARRSQRSARGLEIIVRFHELPLLVGLVTLWMMLWREVTPMTLVSGVLVAIFVMRMFYLPPVDLAGRFHPWYAFRYLMYFLWNVALASVQVSWMAIRPGPPPMTSIIAVKLRTHSDFILTLVGITISLIPGSLVAEVDRFRSILYLHVLNTPTQQEILNMRREVKTIERLLILALGSRTEVKAVRKSS